MPEGTRSTTEVTVHLDRVKVEDSDLGGGLLMLTLPQGAEPSSELTGLGKVKYSEAVFVLDDGSVLARFTDIGWVPKSTLNDITVEPQTSRYSQVRLTRPARVRFSQLELPTAGDRWTAKVKGDNRTHQFWASDRDDTTVLGDYRVDSTDDYCSWLFAKTPMG